ncbi:2,3,4,5-tetrahydropyridine-2,6-dicarboxylate N-acetyltransferase [uncultured archaeon]|nr:2,3,4,5-tetrahydropyridine-2,6-dicarboxylate N-acetyltransferase [uncultured archaeon]
MAMRHLTHHPKTPSEANGMSRWWRHYNPVRTAFNYAIVQLAARCPFMGMKRGLYRCLGARIGKNVSIAPDVILDFVTPELIEIGDGALIGYGALILAHEFLPDGYATGRTVIGPHCLVGARATILAGVRIGEGAQVGAMALVSSDIPANVLAAGVPARVVRKLDARRGPEKPRS